MIANDSNTLPLDERREVARVPAVSAGTGDEKEGQGETTLCLYVLSKCLRLQYRTQYISTLLIYVLHPTSVCCRYVERFETTTQLYCIDDKWGTKDVNVEVFACPNDSKCPLFGLAVPLFRRC